MNPHSGISDHIYSSTSGQEWASSVLVFRDPDNIQLELFVVRRRLTPFD